MDKTIKEFKYCRLFVQDFGRGNVDIRLSGEGKDTWLCDVSRRGIRAHDNNILLDLAENLETVEDPDRLEVAVAVLNYLVEIGH